MTTPFAGNQGARLDLLIRQGATFSLIIDMVNGDGNPVDLAGAVFSAQMRKTGLSPDIVATFFCQVVDAPNGKFSIELSSDVTTLLVCGETLTDALSNYVWDLEMLDTLYRVMPVFYGNVKVQREVTR